MKRPAWWLVVLLLVAAGWGRGQDAANEDELMGDFEKELGSGWWKPEWPWRRTLLLGGPALRTVTDGYVFFNEPDPLLLLNTGRCRSDWGDLRLVDLKGNVLPFGTVDAGADDGSGRFWCRLPKGQEDLTLRVFLYYGNREAPALAAKLPAEIKPEARRQVTAEVLTEEVRPEGQPPVAPAVGAFFADKVWVEVEALTGPLKPAEAPGASGGRFLLARPAADAAAVVVDGKVTIPKAGRWEVYLRQSGAQRGACTVSVGPQTAAVAAQPRPEAGWVWDGAAALELAAGEQPLRVSVAPGVTASPDCLLLSADPGYRPDYRDFNGPVWMRVRARGERAAPYWVNLFCMHTTYSVNGMLGSSVCWMLGDRTLWEERAAGELAKKGNLVKPGAWSPWGRALPSGSFTWFTELRLVGVGKDQDIEFQFATRPDVSRAFREGVENTGSGSTVYVHMPASTNWWHVRGMTMSFGQWAEQRFGMARDLGFRENEGPRHIVVGAMADAYSPEEFKYILKTFNWLGINTASIYAPCDPAALNRIYEESGVSGFWAHGWVGGLSLGEKPAPGKTFTETAMAAMAADAAQQAQAVAATWRKQTPWQIERLRFNIMGDEIGAFTDFEGINKDPQLHGLYVEYLQAHQVTPDHFGVKTWDEVKAFGFAAPPSEKEVRKQAAEAAKKAGEAEFEKVSAENALLGGEDQDLGKVAEEAKTEVAQAMKEEAEKAQQRLVSPEQVKAREQYQRRAYHWTQRFRGYYTALVLQAHSAAAEKHWPAGVYNSPNLQAMPVQIGQMWDGSLNVFDLGRTPGPNALLVEDWWGGPNNVSFASNLLRAAGRKHGQTVAAMIVGGGPSGRMMADLMEGCTVFLAYLYGPIYRIGPVWAEDAQTYREFGEMDRQIARCEQDLLAARPRARDAALLVANTSEISSAWFSYPIGRQRIGAYAALVDSQVPVDVVGQEEVLEDGALARYRILYVTDPHVDRQVQEKIKEWVAGGGCLWADYGGLARAEYDERCPVLDEVFGLADRGEILSFPCGGYGAPALPPGQGLKVPESDVFHANEIKGIWQSPDGKNIKGLFYQPGYKTGTGRVLASFADGSPALVQNRYGKGQAYLCGLLAGLAYSGYFSYSTWGHYLAYGGPSTALTAELLTRPAGLAGVRKHLVGGRLFLQTAVWDGPAQSLVFLNNMGAEAKDETLTVALPRAPKSAYSSLGREVKWEYAEGQAKFGFSLAHGKGEVVVFSY